MTEAGQPARGRPAVVDPDLVEAARILRGALVRVHPSFRFEERLATRLGTAAVALAPDDVGDAHPWPDPIPFRGPDGFDHGARVASPASSSPAEGRRWRPTVVSPNLVRLPRGALIGGAIASGVSLAGAAFLARRWRSRPSRSPFARAARAAHRATSDRVRPVRGGMA